MPDQSPTEYLLKQGNLSDAEIYAIHRFLRGITIEFELTAHTVIERYRNKQVLQEANGKAS